MIRLLLLLALALSALPAAAQQLDIYNPAEGTADVQHKLIKGTYVVHFAATGVSTTAGQKTTLKIPSPERGEMKRGPIKSGGLVKATSRLDGDTLVVTLEHGDFRMPAPDAISNTAPNSKSLGPIVDKLGRGWIGSKRNVKGKLRGMLRRRSGNRVRELLVTMAQCYHGALEKVAAEERAKDRQAVASLLGISPFPSDAEEQTLAIRQAIHGYRVGGRFKPAAGVGVPTRASVRGEIGRAVLKGAVGGDDTSDDWWRLEVPKDAKVYDVEVPDSVRFFIVRDPADKQVLLLRLRADGAGGAYKLEVRNKRGQEHKWIELHERPAEDDGSLPY